MNSVGCLGRDLTDHRGVQSIPLSDRVAERRFRLDIQQRRGDPHLQRAVNQQHTAWPPLTETDCRIYRQRRLANPPFVTDERDHTAERGWLKPGSVFVGRVQIVEQRP